MNRSTVLNSQSTPAERDSSRDSSWSDSALIEEVRRLREEVERLRAQPALPIPNCNQPFISKELSESELGERQSFAEGVQLPDRDAPTFSLVNDFLTIGVTPWADPLIPAYLLDKNYRIVDWNFAFSLAFDRTMEGRRGLSVLEWVYFLDNYEESLRKAERDFADPDHLPAIHVEDIEYTSPQYGKIVAKKRAYQMPKDDGKLLGWLVMLEPKFTDLNTTLRYKRDLFASLRRDMTWSEYAFSYDRVLLASKTYIDLLKHILGEQVPAGGEGTLTSLPNGARVLDLGAGTGNVAWMLAQKKKGHVIFAVENNRIMLDMLRDKCQNYLRTDDQGPGILAIKQDVNTLFGLPTGAFDYAILNNVLYALEDPLPCLRQVRESLRPNGEIRMSGPQKTTDLKTLFAQIENDLTTSGAMAERSADFQRVWEINQNVLSANLYRWTLEDMKQILQEAGFGEIIYSTDSAYAGQSMVLAARKRRRGGGRA